MYTYFNFNKFTFDFFILFKTLKQTCFYSTSDLTHTHTSTRSHSAAPRMGPGIKLLTSTFAELQNQTSSFSLTRTWTRPSRTVRDMRGSGALLTVFAVLSVGPSSSGAPGEQRGTADGTLSSEPGRTTCPDRCRCEEDGLRHRTDCSDRGLREVPNNLSVFTSFLWVQPNRTEPAVFYLRITQILSCQRACACTGENLSTCLYLCAAARVGGDGGKNKQKQIGYIK